VPDSVIGAIGTFAIHCNHLNPSFTSCFTHPSKQSSIASGQSFKYPGTCLHSSRWLEPETSITKRVCSPHNSMSSQPSPPAITDRIAIVKISDNRCKRVRSTRGSSIVAKHVCRRWLRVFAAATDESVGAEQNHQSWGESSQGAGFCLIILRFSVRSGENRADSFL